MYVQFFDVFKNKKYQNDKKNENQKNIFLRIKLLEPAEFQLEWDERMNF